MTNGVKTEVNAWIWRKNFPQADQALGFAGGLFGKIMIFRDGLVDEPVHGFVEPVFAQFFAIGLSIQGAICLISEALQFFGQIADFDISAAFGLFERFGFGVHIESIDW